MHIKINYTNKKINKNSSNLILFCDEKFNVEPVKKDLSKEEFKYIKDLLKIFDQKKNLITFEINSKKKNYTYIN